VSSRRGDCGQALIEFALGLPLLIAAALLGLAFIDAATTQEAVESGARRSSLVLAASNVDAQAVGAASDTSWLRGQRLAAGFTPPDTSLRCLGTTVTLTLGANGHLGFLLPFQRTWSATVTTAIEQEGPQRDRCQAAGP
jgi:Flp pilus assembly protein TadG